MEEFVKALRSGTNDAYQFVCDHGHELSKGELCEILKEFIFVGDKATVEYEEDFIDQVADSIEDNCIL